jgi:ACT domain-containing protein
VKAIITVLGNDKVGIIAKTCSYLASNNINILDISQTIVQDYFNMLMIVDIQNSKLKFENLTEALTGLGNEIGVVIKIQHEDIFNSMHRV